MGDFAGFLNALRLAGEGSPRSHPRSAYLKALPFTVQRVVVPSARGRHRVRREAMPEGIEVAMIFLCLDADSGAWARPRGAITRLLFCAMWRLEKTRDERDPK
jgi:hypothetical protein